MMTVAKPSKMLYSCQRRSNIGSSHVQYPTPTRISSDSVHVGNGISQQTGEGSSYDGRAKEKIDAPLQFMSLVV